MKTLNLLQSAAALALLALAGNAQLSAAAGGAPGNSLQTARGKWYRSANANDQREVLLGHITDQRGIKVATLVATLLPGDDPYQTPGLRSGLMYGELRRADTGRLADALGQVLDVPSQIERPIGIVGRWQRRADGVGRFDALVTLGGHVIIGSLSGVYGADLMQTLGAPAGSAALSLSTANPFDVSLKGGPLTIAETDPGGILPPPFSTPRRLIRAGDFVAALRLDTL